MLQHIKRIKTELLTGVEALVQDKHISYIDATISFCESRGIDLEQAATIIINDKKMTKKIENEAADLNFFKKIAI